MGAPEGRPDCAPVESRALARTGWSVRPARVTPPSEGARHALRRPGWPLAAPAKDGPSRPGSRFRALSRGTARTRVPPVSPAAPLPAPTHVVLDTNVVLDLFVFEDPFARPLAEGLSAGALIPWADAATLRELELVLAYPSFALDAQARRAVLERYAGLARRAPDDTGTAPLELPRCRDRDDQKFLALAARAQAAWLVSKDKRVLSMAGGRLLPFAILTPRQAVARLREAAPPTRGEGAGGVTRG